MNCEIDKNRMDLVGVQEVRWVRSGSFESGNYSLFYEKGKANHQLGTGFFCKLGQQSKRWNLSATLFLVLPKGLMV